MIYLSAGHSNVDPGATTTIKDEHGKVVGIRKEADIAAEVRNIVSFYLHRAGVEHDVDGKGTENLPLAATVKEINSKRLPALEFHCNAGPAAASGCETLSSVKNTALGERICKAISESLGIKNRGAKPENAGQHHRLAFVQAGGIIVELFFISNADDLRKYDERKWLMGKAIAGVLMEPGA